MDSEKLINSFEMKKRITKNLIRYSEFFLHIIYNLKSYISFRSQKTSKNSFQK